MKYFKTFVVVALGLSLSINVNVLSKLDNLEHRVNSISSDQRQVINSVNSQTNNIRNVLNDMQREQSWLSPIRTTTKITDIAQGKAVVNFEWQVKELEDNSQVVFNYKNSNSDEGEYTTIDPATKGNGLFEVNIPIEVTLEPEWRFQITNRSSGEDAARERAAREEMIEEYKRNSQVGFKYFVSVDNGGMVKSGEINVTQVDNLGVRQYGYLETIINISRDGHYSVSVLGNSAYRDSSSILKEVYLKKYKDGKVVSEQKLVSQEINEPGMPVREHHQAFHTEPVEENKIDDSSLVVKAIYSDGATFEREVY